MKLKGLTNVNLLFVLVPRTNSRAAKTARHGDQSILS